MKSSRPAIFTHRFADLVFFLLTLAKETGEQQTTQPPTA
jgi:hypothetical protein